MKENSKKKVRCIICPEGCIITATVEKNTKKVLSLEGNRCKRGIRFTEDEVKNPVRILTTTINIDSKIANRLPVRSDVPAPRDMLFKLIEETKKIKVKPPVLSGDILLKNAAGTKVNIISSTTLLK